MIISHEEKKMETGELKMKKNTIKLTNKEKKREELELELLTMLKDKSELLLDIRIGQNAQIMYDNLEIEIKNIIKDLVNIDD